MQPAVDRLMLALKAIRQLGLQPVALNALYQLGLATGYYRRVTSGRRLMADHAPLPIVCRPLFILPPRADLLAVLGTDGMAVLLIEADEIVAGRVRLFGAQPVELNLTLPGRLEHWTAYETGKADLRPLTFDIKLLWEPARFGWAFTLGRAWHLTGDEKYAQAFWRYFETFTDANPPCLGPHWMSAQEVALRLMAFVWAGQVFETASSPQRKARLAAAVAAHAARIPSTLVYARSQQNNHLLTEAAGLLTAGLALPGHPRASRWRSLGWRWLNKGLQSQVDGYGEYAQHSTNYHRLMLQVVLWTNAISRVALIGKYRWPHPTRAALKRSVHWLLALLDFESGRVPNLGANDGADIFPLSISTFSDFRPVLHASARAFLGYDLPRGAWDELAFWFGVQAGGPRTITLPRYLGDQLYGQNSWAYFRTAQFTTRPSHADQLHLDLWWRGLNMTRDAGTFLYNAPAPWDNSLTTALVHNTVTLNGRDQFTRSGRFLYLDWLNAYRTNPVTVDSTILQQVRAHYRAMGYRHTRTVSVCEHDRWLVLDEILPLRMLPKKKPFTVRLHWLLPDFPWRVESHASGVTLFLESPFGQVTLSITYDSSQITDDLKISLFSAGELVHGSAPPDLRRGWVSPTYALKVPALSLAVETESTNEVKFTTQFIFPP